MSMQPMFAIQSRASSSLTSGKSTHFFVLGDCLVETSVRNVGIHWGMCDGASFWKNFFPSIPSGQRTIVKGRSLRWGTSVGATAR
jgi:hypothetical protein